MYDKLTYFFFNLFLLKQYNKYYKVKRYTYRVDLINPLSRKKPMKSSFVSLRLVRLFYLTLKYKQFRLLSSKASKKDGFFQANYCFLLECRLLPVMYRASFIRSIFEIIEKIKKGDFLVNKGVVSLVNSPLKVGDLVSLVLLDLNKVRNNFLRRFILKGFVFNVPRFLFVNYKFFFVIIERQPFDNDLAFPFKIDIYRATSFY